MKQCSCGAGFTIEDLILLRALDPIGMVQNAGRPAIFFFTHVEANCLSTFGVPVEAFRDQIDEEIPPALAAGTDLCRSYCTSLESLEECGADCSLAPYRRFLLGLLKR